MVLLSWIGKDQIVNHDKEVPFRLLKKVKSLSFGKSSQNLIVHGDNLEALKALMPYYHNKVKCIYIDPPYNTGNENWVYNDKVNSPKIKKWLGKVVGPESEDLCRHDKWLCMMYPRLKLLRELLSETGTILVSIDDNEQHNLKSLLNAIFGEENFVANLIWHKKITGGYDSKHFNVQHEYILVYSRNIQTLKINFDKNTESKYTLRDKNGRLYKWDSLWNVGGLTYSSSLDYAIVAPDGSKIHPPGERGKSFWLWSKDKVINERDQLKFEKNKKGQWRVYKKVYASDELVPSTLLKKEVVGGNTNATAEIKQIFSTKAFEHAKPASLISYLLSKVGDENAIILDSFAGSGTTGHAVLDLNKNDRGNRKFILVEMEDYAKDITAERLKRAITKYDYNDGFEFCELDKPLFNEYGQIDEQCSFDQLATYIYFTETQTNIDTKKLSENFIGDYNGTSYYLIFDGRGKNVLNKHFVKKITKDPNKKIVYADKCLVDEDSLEKYGIVFKQIPYEVQVY
jgi:adenine-specific DNA-methyltransferase